MKRRSRTAVRRPRLVEVVDVLDVAPAPGRRGHFVATVSYRGRVFFAMYQGQPVREDVARDFADTCTRRRFQPQTEGDGPETTKGRGVLRARESA